MSQNTYISTLTAQLANPSYALCSTTGVMPVPSIFSTDADSIENKTLNAKNVNGPSVKVIIIALKIIKIV